MNNECETVVPAKYQVFENQDYSRQLAERGYVVVPLFSEAQIAALWDVYNSRISDLPSNFFTTAFSADDEFRRLLFDALTQLANDTLRTLLSSYTCRLAHFVVKRGGEPDGKLPMHQDYTFSDPSTALALHLWCPLQDVTVFNSCLQVVPGSHEFFQHICAIPGNPHPYWALVNELEAKYLISVPMRAGEALVYDGRLLHGSGGNSGVSPRVAVNFMMLPDGVNPRLYCYDGVDSEFLDVVEFGFDRFKTMNVLEAPKAPYPEGVSFVERIPFAMRQRSNEDLKELDRFVED